MEVLSAFPKLYWREDCPPGREWARLSPTMYGADSRRMWSGEDEEESWSSVVALPGKKNLGIGRHWHFGTVPFWVLTGAVYIVLMFVSGWWRYLVPTSWDIVPDSIHAIGTYLHFQLPEPIPGEPYEPAQKLAYFVVVFLLAPFQIATGAAMSRRSSAGSPGTGSSSGASRALGVCTSWGSSPSRGFVLLHTFLVRFTGSPRSSPSSPWVASRRTGRWGCGSAWGWSP